MSRGAEHIFRTIAFAEAFGMPLTGFEVWQWLLCDEADASVFAEMSLLDVLQALAVLKAEGHVIEQDGYYTFPDHEALIEERIRGFATATQKLARARRWARWIARIPYVRGVFADGSLATGLMREESDLDILIITHAGRIFTARLFVTFFTELFGIRRTRGKVRDKICLNHYATEKTLAFPYRSAFTAWLLARLFPLAVNDAALADELVLANAWVGEYFPNLRYAARSLRRAEETREASASAAPFERLLRTLQLSRIRKNPLSRKPGGRVVANNEMLLFHPELPEEEVLHAYRDRCQKLGIGISSAKAPRS